MNTSVREAIDDPRGPIANSGTPARGMIEAPSPRFPVIEGPYLRDLLDQPHALQCAVDGLAQITSIAEVARDLAGGKFRRVVLTGMGSSLYALYPLHLALSRHGISSFWVETAELLLGFEVLYRPDTLLVAVSQSGESAEIVNLLRRAGEFGHVIGVTNNPQSRLGRQSGTALLLNAGVESTVSCKSYLTTLAVLHWLGAALLQGDLPSTLGEVQIAERGVRDYLSRWREHVDELLTLTEGVHSVFVTGRAESLATTGTAGLILKESTRHHAEGMSCAAFRHGPLEMIGDKVFVLVFTGDERVSGLNRRLAEDISQRFARIVPEPGNPTNRVLWFWLNDSWKADGGVVKARVQADIYGVKVGLKEFYQSVRIFLPEDWSAVKRYPHSIPWYLDEDDINWIEFVKANP